MLAPPHHSAPPMPLLRLALAAAPRSARLIPLVVWIAAVLLASAAEAQVVRPSQSVYVLLRGGATLYHGDIDLDSDENENAAELQLIDQLEDAGPSLGAEVGYQFDESLSFGLGYVFQKNENISANFGPIFNNDFDGYLVSNDDDLSHQFRALIRYLPFPGARLTPVVELGGALVLGNGTEAERNNAELGGAGDDRVLGFGPVLGLGLDFALTPRLSVVGGLQSALVFPDVALDGADPGVYGQDADDADYDILANLGLGLKYAFFSPITPVRIEGLQCPGELVVGETGTFTVVVNDDATQPVQIAWDFGDGAAGTGPVTTHTFDAPGTYTVTATATNEAGPDSEQCLVTVVGIAPTLADCRATPSTVGPGGEVTVDAVVTGTEPVQITVDFGDGTTASTLPARHAYAAPGEYTVTITVSNAYGTDVCTIPVLVGDTFCEDVTELNSVFFGYGSDALTADARARLDENIEILRRCPDICVRIYGYSDGDEPNPLRIAQRRAEAVRDYYVAQGIDPDRLCPEGRGVDPEASPKEDPGPGDSRARRADSIPMPCAEFECD